MAKIFLPPCEFLYTTPERLRAVVCTNKDGVKFVELYDKDDETNGILSLPLMFGDKIKDGNINPSFLSIVKINDKYVATVDDYYYAFESNAKACLDKYIKLAKIEAEDLENIEIESDSDWLDMVSELKSLANYADECECNPTEYTIKVVLSGIIRLTRALADIINK